MQIRCNLYIRKASLTFIRGLMLVIRGWSLVFSSNYLFMFCFLSELAEQMMLKLSVLLREASLRNSEMAVSNVK